MSAPLADNFRPRGCGWPQKGVCALDKLALRKEFQKTLAEQGITLDFLVGRLKKVISSDNDKVALQGIQTVMKTIGVDRPDDEDTQGRAWEDVVLENAQQAVETTPGHYEVVQPEMPESLRAKKDEEKRTGRELYE